MPGVFYAYDSSPHNVGYLFLKKNLKKRKIVRKIRKSDVIIGAKEVNTLKFTKRK
jgi:hypothetical protein